MKISKLFHWLYATLMFLPILMFIPSCLYFGFNHEAKAQEYTHLEPTYYESNEVDSFDDLQIGHIYQYTFKDSQPTQANQITFNASYIVEMSFTYKSINNTTIQQNQKCFIFDYDGRHYFRYFYLDGEQYKYIDYYNFIGLIVYEDSANKIDVYSYLTETTQQVQNGQEEVTHTMSISDSINYAWERTWNLPVFAWTQNSFVTAPFSYITGLFGLSSDNSINYVFTYFVSISICWLVFDLIMYVPNLAHRWLDKGALE